MNQPLTIRDNIPFLSLSTIVPPSRTSIPNLEMAHNRWPSTAAQRNESLDYRCFPYTGTLATPARQECPITPATHYFFYTKSHAQSGSCRRPYVRTYFSKTYETILMTLHPPICHHVRQQSRKFNGDLYHSFREQTFTKDSHRRRRRNLASR